MRRFFNLGTRGQGPKIKLGLNKMGSLEESLVQRITHHRRGQARKVKSSNLRAHKITCFFESLCSLENKISHKLGLFMVI